jgi:hypothetical protein
MYYNSKIKITFKIWQHVSTLKKLSSGLKFKELLYKQVLHVHWFGSLREPIQLWYKNFCLISWLVALWMQSARDAPKNGEPSFDFPIATMFQHTSRIWSRKGKVFPLQA